MTNAIDSLNPGQNITCTITKEPRAKGPTLTIARLMRRDPTSYKSLRRAQHLRLKRMHRYIRGNRLWSSREKAAKVVHVNMGQSWTMPYTPDLAPDLKSVESYLEIKPAN